MMVVAGRWCGFLLNNKGGGIYMKKIVSVLAAGIAAVACAVSASACNNRENNNELKLYCNYKDTSYTFTLPVKCKIEHSGGSYAKIKSTSDMSTLYGKLKSESGFVEEYGNSLLFLADAENHEYPQYVAMSYKGVNDDDSKYYDYEAMQQSAEYFYGENAVYFSFPLIYVSDLAGAYLAFESNEYSVNVDCTFEQLKTFYTRLDYAFVSATEDSVNVKGYIKKSNEERNTVYEDVGLTVKYADGAVTVSATE